jgi:hypothetical protein
MRRSTRRYVQFPYQRTYITGLAVLSTDKSVDIQPGVELAIRYEVRQLTTDSSKDMNLSDN